MIADRWVKRFSQEALPIIRKQFDPQRVLLFGSRAFGKASEESDLDIIIVASSFGEIPFIKRMSRVRKVASFPKHVDYLCYTPEEFEEIQTSSSVIQDAMENYQELE